MAAAKTRALRLAYERFSGAEASRRQAFAEFRRERGPLLGRFAVFEFLRRRFGKPWRQWPDQWHNPSEADLAALRLNDGDAIGFFEFVQWVADTQLEACRRRAHDLALPIGLYLDVAVGMHPEGFDAWNDQRAVMSELSVGAPPDLYNTAGQNWGLAAFNPDALEAERFAPFRSMLQAAMRYAGAIRLDHVLGLKRLYLIPEGMRAGQGVYVRFPFAALLAVSAQESIRQRCIVIGEDLGTVPDGFRDTLADWGIWSYQVMLFERAADGSFLPPESYRENALVTFGTHDLPTFAGWMRGHDLAVKRALNMDPGETDRERTAAQLALRSALAARRRGPGIHLGRPLPGANAGASIGGRHRGCVGHSRSSQRSGDHRRAPELAASAAGAAGGSEAARRPRRRCRCHGIGRSKHPERADRLSVPARASAPRHARRLTRGSPGHGSLDDQALVGVQHDPIRHRLALAVAEARHQHPPDGDRRQERQRNRPRAEIQRNQDALLAVLPEIKQQIRLRRDAAVAARR